MARIRRRRTEDLPQAVEPQSAGESAPASGADAPTTEQQSVGASGPTTTDAPTSVLPVPAADPGNEIVVAEPGDLPTAELLAPSETLEELPAGANVAFTTSPERPGFRERGQLRRRLRYLRRVRELGFRDLGGLTFDLARFERDRPDLIQAKLDALTATDAELRAIEVALNDLRPIHELREPGLAACDRCGALHGSDARFCSACGNVLDGPGVLPGAFAAGASVAPTGAGDPEPSTDAAAEPPSPAPSEPAS